MLFAHALCILLHLIFAPPAAGEATRGYLHGGLLIDFVGVESPVSKARLVIDDVLVATLQVICLAVVLERRKITPASPPSSNTADETAPSPSPITDPSSFTPPHDHDSEERGILPARLALLTSPSNNTNTMELQPLSAGRTGADQDHERDELSHPAAMVPTSSSAAAHDHPLDAAYSGQSIIAEIGILTTVREQYVHTERTGASTAMPAETRARMRAVRNALAMRVVGRLGFRGSGQRT